MNVISTSLPGVYVFEPIVYGDERGFFYESYNAEQFKKNTNLDIDFVQDNHSRSSKGVLRGLHYQLSPHAQGKLVRCIQGSVFDVAVDIRPDSPFFGRWVGYELNESNRRMLWIPPGFAHGFLTLSSTAEFLYKTSSYYAPLHDRSIVWNDSRIAIEWPLVGLEGPILSKKDANAPILENAQLA
jgi:dTDP-4-dehydrorhamnose 3,5-epimerase